jgi:hypothetical protein
MPPFSHSMKRTTSLFFLLISFFRTQAQDSKTTFQIVLPSQPYWNVTQEGSRIEFQLSTVGSAENSVFSLVQGRLEGMELDTIGHFVWTPDYDVAERINSKKSIQLLIKAQNIKGETTSKTIELTVIHTNRPPQIESLQPYYVQFRSPNLYRIDAQFLRDDDGDPVVIIPIPESLPEGMRLSSQGEFMWQPSQMQFNQLKNKPFYIDFYLEDQPQKARSKGRIKVESTQLDLPPNITQIPQNEHYDIKENMTIDLKFFLSDPNGDDDIVAFDFVSNNAQVTTKSLIKNTPNQYEFIWTPSYDFVKDPYDSLTFTAVFFVIDKTQKRDELKISFTVRNAVNEAEKDTLLYSQYRSALVEAWTLLEQLSEKEQTLKQAYLRAKKGKRNRSVATATLGAVTGISPAIITTTDNRTIVSAIGGTAILTIGTLEATEVIGKSLKDILERYNYVLEKKIEIQSKGDIFAREYALKSSRRTADYIRKKDEFKLALILKGPVTLDLDAGWENKKEATNKAISHSFKDFLILE